MRHTRTTLCWCNKRQQRTSNTSGEGTPSLRVCVCVCVRRLVYVFLHNFPWSTTVCVCVCVGLYMFSCMSSRDQRLCAGVCGDFILQHSPRGARPGVPVWAPQRGWLCVSGTIGPGRSWLAVELHKLGLSCPVTALSRRQRTGPVSRLRGRGPERGAGLVRSLMFAGGKGVSPTLQEWEIIPPTHAECVCSQGSHNPANSLLLLLLSLPHLFNTLLKRQTEGMLKRIS